MSGGALGYAHLKIQEIVDELKKIADSRQQEQFAQKLEKFVAPMRAVEWYHSGDSSFEDAQEAICKAGFALTDSAEEREDDILRSFKQLYQNIVVNGGYPRLKDEA